LWIAILLTAIIMRPKISEVNIWSRDILLALSFLKSSAVRISDVIYRNMNGTTRSARAINLKCSKNTGCTNLGFENINIISSVPWTVPYAYCENAYGWFSSSFPSPTCLWKWFFHLHYPFNYFSTMSLILLYFFWFLFIAYHCNFGFFG